MRPLNKIAAFGLLALGIAAGCAPDYSDREGYRDNGRYSGEHGFYHHDHGNYRDNDGDHHGERHKVCDSDGDNCHWETD